MLKFVLIVLIVIVYTCIQNVFALGNSDELVGHQLVEITSVNPRLLNHVIDQFILDVWDYELPNLPHSSYKVLARVDPRMRDALNSWVSRQKRHQDLSLAIVHSNIAELVVEHMRSISNIQVFVSRYGAASESPINWFRNYHTFEDIQEWFLKLSNSHKNIVQYIPSIGKSHEGRDIFALRINRTPPRGDKKQIYIQSLIHAREWISGAVVQFICHELITKKDIDLSPKVLDVEVIVVPVVNPDGYAYTWLSNRLWRKNRNPGSLFFGVDLNRNFDDHWQSSNVPNYSEVYPGKYASSEPETIAIQSFFGSLQNVIGALDMHSFSQLVLYPYGWTYQTHPRKDTYVRVGNAISAAFKDNQAKRNHSSYDATYRVMQSSSLYPAYGTASDWFGGASISSYSKKNYEPLSLTIELPPIANNRMGGFLLKPELILPVSQDSYAAFGVFVEQCLDQALMI
jgi:hypothetical protein